VRPDEVRIGARPQFTDETAAAPRPAARSLKPLAASIDGFRGQRPVESSSWQTRC
jgi:hypothetical protein